ncbi:flagellar hook assembly protein FlgD [Mariprofundus ferrooxydans]|uniref:flagellar hook assembly protein FlgD n=1 Tax=Mariprofundus ferrooxydans TaxID=314344 RepID=UPI000371D074|nr:flagellar hook capping FlgD N-terminal domain-containing protein [Mariprofundus ferrooxydans]
MLTPTAAASGQAAQPARTTQSDLGKKDIFLKLLMAQMKNQDPLKPQDPTQMSSQLAQFNMVEQQTSTNKLLQQIVDAGSNSGSSATIGTSNAAGYLGHTVTANQNQVNFDGTTQKFNVVTTAAASDSIISIVDQSGNPVRTMAGSLAAGNNPLIWDGKTDSGATAPKGAYSVNVSAVDINGAKVNATVQRTGIVNAVRFTPGGADFMVGGVATSATAITEIRL